jgi:hypothetical protein
VEIWNLTAEATVEILRDLRRAYKRYFKHPDDDLRWRACESHYQKATEALKSSALSDVVDPAIAAAVESGHATPAQAAPNLREAGREILDPERRLGWSLGYDDHEFAGLVKLATDALGAAQREGRALHAPQTAAALAEQLTLVHERVHAAFSESIEEPRKTKKAHREEAREYLTRSLYAVGAIVANAAAQELFAYSYALSLGVHYAPPATRSRTRIPISERSLAA